MKFAVIGTGIVGTALAVLLERAGNECVGVNTRSEISYQHFREYLNKDLLPLDRLVALADVLFITTQDGMIRSVAETLVREGLIKTGQLWVHCSGSLSSEVLRVFKDIPVRCLSIHPLQTFTNVKEALSILAGSNFGVEGDDVDEGEFIVRTLGGIPHRLKPEGKVLYHTGAVMISNYTVVLAHLAKELLIGAGIESDNPLELLLPLLKGTLHNIEKVGTPLALTGPIARGDAEVVKSHLENIPERILELYKALGREALELARSKSEKLGMVYPVELKEKIEYLLTLNHYHKDSVEVRQNV